MPDSLRAHTSRRGVTPQSQPARSDQVKNNAGGYTFAVGDGARLNRFLTIGTEGGTYHVKERELTRDNAALVTRLAEASNHDLIDQAVAVSTAGRAPSNNPALFALAAAAGLGSTEYRARALSYLPQVSRTGMHQLTFAAYAELFRGWGPQLVRAMREWFLGKTPDELAYQLLKYKQRNGWSQKDLIRLAGRKGISGMVPPEHEQVFAYIMKGEPGDGLPVLFADARRAHATRKVSDWVGIIQGNRSLSWEMLPSEALGKPEVWEALVMSGNLPQGALIRNLARMSAKGVLKPGSALTREVASRIADPQRLSRARVHPITLLLAMKTYAGGHSLRGKGTWAPVPAVTDAMDAGFYAAFPSVKPSGQRTAICLDISGTMGSPAGGLPITCREVVAAVAMTVMASEPRVAGVWGFSGRGDYSMYGNGGQNYMMPLDISPRRRLDDIVSYTSRLPMGRTDCALPMVHALHERIEVDVFQVWTDNETWAGPIHPHQALAQYREKMGINARLQVVCVVPTEFSVADPKDPRQLDVSGFDAAVPVLLADHARGELDPGFRDTPREENARDEDAGAEEE